MENAALRDILRPIAQDDDTIEIMDSNGVESPAKMKESISRILEDLETTSAGSPVSLATTQMSSTSPSASDLSMSPSIYPTVTMGEDGAEVTIGSIPDAVCGRPSKLKPRPSGSRDMLGSLESHTRNDSFDRAIPARSLLDDERSTSHLTVTSTPAKSTPEPILCCSGPNFWMLKDSDVVDAQQQLEKNISLFLSDPCNVDICCSGWQAWSHFGEVLDAEDSKELKEDIRSVLRNRAHDMNARVSRVQQLRKNLSPFGGTPTKPGPLAQSRSFVVGQQQAMPSALPSPRKASKGKRRSSFAMVWESVQNCTFSLRTYEESPVFKRRLNPADDDTCYDSDPEYFIRRPSQQAARQMLGLGKENLPAPRKTKCLYSASPSRCVDMEDEDAVQMAVQGFMNETKTLKLHQAQRPEILGPCSPVAVKVWIERGQRMKKTLIQPRIAWQPVNRLNRLNRSRRCQESRDGSRPAIESVDLLDVTRVLGVDRVDRQEYPLAKQQHCFILKTLEETLLFEAGSVEERDQLVWGFKMLVARFGSKIIVADNSVFDEFFLPPQFHPPVS